MAVLFLGIFVTMTPALAAVVRARGEGRGSRAVAVLLADRWAVVVPGQCPDLCDVHALAAEGDNFGALAANRPLILAAISCGAVFMGANSYIGNGPNFGEGYRREPRISDAVVLRVHGAYVLPVLLPVFAVLTWVFFA